jgi:glyoxylase-like metal-dependent hydrolase (beta-lactamase superfamily II)
VPSATQAVGPPQDAPAPLYPDTTFSHSWSAEVGDERIVARHHGRGHTSGDAVITFERANVVHMGDLMLNQRHPVVDRAAGASIHNWTRLLDQVVNAHARDTIYIFGHANTGLSVTGSSADLLKFRDYLGARAIRSRLPARR